MNWEPLEREYTTEFKLEPIITLNPHQIRFNGSFVCDVGLFSYSFVNAMVDETKHCIGFFFHNEQDYPNKFKLTKQKNVASMTSHALVKKYPWIEKVAKNIDPKKRRFKPIHDKNIWYICLDN